MVLVASFCVMKNNIYKEYHLKLTECFSLIEKCYWDLQEVYDETKINYKFDEKNSATLPYGLWKFYLIEECSKEIEVEKGKGIYSLSCDNLFNLIKDYANWKPKDENDWNNGNDLLGISGKAKECLSNIIFDLYNRKDGNVEFYRDLELPVE
jgi:hypothetical protein